MEEFPSALMVDTSMQIVPETKKKIEQQQDVEQEKD